MPIISHRGFRESLTTNPGYLARSLTSGKRDCSMMTSLCNPRISVWAAMLLGLIFCLQTGCTAIKPFGSQEIPMTDSEPTDQCMVKITPKFGQTRSTILNVNDETTIQTVLEETGAISDFRSMKINIFRQVMENGQTLRLPVEYNSQQNRAREEWNYAIHPGDTITIGPKSSSGLDKFVDTVFGSRN